MFYIYDCSTGKLIISQFSGGCITEDDEIAIIARDAGMNVDEINSGRVTDLQIDFGHPQDHFDVTP